MHALQLVLIGVGILASAYLALAVVQEMRRPPAKGAPHARAARPAGAADGAPAGSGAASPASSRVGGATTNVAAADARGRTFLPPRDDDAWRPLLRAEVDPEAVRALSSGLPVLPIAAGRLVSALEDARTDPRTVARIAATDPSLAARLLMVVNSAFFGLPKRTGDLNRAVILLGYAQIKGIVFRSVLNETLSKEGADAAALDRMWERSYLLSLAAPVLAQEIGGSWSPNISTAGLFLDVGKIALLARHKEKARAVYGDRLADDRHVARREEEAFRVNHAVAGALLGEKWKLPSDVVQMIECHLPAYFWAAPFLPIDEMRNVTLLHLTEAAVDRFLAARIQMEMEEAAAAGAPAETPVAPFDPDPFYFHLVGLEPPITDLMSTRLLAVLEDGQAFISRFGAQRTSGLHALSRIG